MCDFDAAIDEIASASAQPPIDCGVVDLDDTLLAWETARNCALEAIEDGAAVKFRWRPRTIDSVNYDTIAVNPGAMPPITWLNFSAYDGEQIFSYTCSQIAQQENCTVEVGQMCFDCIGRGPNVDVCP